MTTVMEGIQIVVTAKGAKIVRKQLEDVGKAGKKSEAGVKGLGASLKILSAGLVAREVITLVDTFTNMQNRLKLVTTGSQNLGAVTSRLGKIARDTRTSFEGTATIFSRVALATKELGVSQESLLHFTESLNQATILSGASSKEAFNGIIQLSQGMGAGALRGDELRSVLEQLPAVADTIARGMGVARASLRELGKEGAITSKVILEAFSKDRQRLMLQFAETVPTMGQAFEVLRTDVIFFLATFNEVLGASSAIAEAMIFVGSHINELGFIVVGVATFFATNYVIAMASATASTFAFSNVLAMLARNRIALLVSAFVAVVGYLITFRQTMSEAGGVIGFIGEVVQGLVTYLTILWRTLSVLNKAFNKAFGDWAPIIKTVGTALVGLIVFFKLYTVSLVQVRLATAALWTLMKANPFTLLALAITAAGVLLWKFKENLGGLGDIITAIGKVFAKVFDFIKKGLAELGIIELGKNGEINLNINGEDAAGSMSDGIKEAGDVSAAAMKEAVITGGKSAANSIGKAAASGGKAAADKLRAGAPAAGDSFGKAAAAPVAKAADRSASVFEAAGVNMSQAAFDIMGATGRYQDAVRMMVSAINAQIFLTQMQGKLVEQQALALQDAGHQASLDRMRDTNVARINAAATVAAAKASASGSGSNRETVTVQNTNTGRDVRAFVNRGMDKGGSFEVAGKGGVDKNMLSLNNRPIVNVSRGETVSVSPEDKRKKRDSGERSSRPPQIINFNITTPDADSFNRSEAQIKANMATALARANERNN